MTQINTILNKNNTLRHLFEESFCPTGYTCDHEQNVVENIFGYLSINRLKDELLKTQSCPLNFYNRYKPYSSETIKGCIQEVAQNDKDSIVIYRSTDEKTLKTEVVDLDDFEELNTASCPLNQFLTIGKDIARVFRRKSTETPCLAVIFVNSYTTNFIDKLFSSIPKLMPSLYPNNEIPQDDFELFKSLAVSDYTSVEKIINKKCGELNIAEIIMRREFEGYENIAYEKRKDEARRNLEEVEQNYQTYTERLQRALRDVNEAKTVYDALCNFKPQPSTTFIDFMLSHKNIDFRRKRPDRSDVFYVVDETIEYFAEDMFESYYNNENCGFMRMANPKTKTILRGLFLKQYGKVRVYSEFKLESLCSLYPLYAGEISGVDYSDHFVHPHLGRYRCLGGNEMHIASYFKSGDWDLAIEQSVAATKNLNFGDSTVMGGFVVDINEKLSTNGKYIVANNGQLMTLKEFVKYVEQLEKEEKENSEEKKEDEQTN